MPQPKIALRHHEIEGCPLRVNPNTAPLYGPSPAHAARIAATQAAGRLAAESLLLADAVLRSLNPRAEAHHHLDITARPLYRWAGVVIPRSRRRVAVMQARALRLANLDFNTRLPR